MGRGSGRRRDSSTIEEIRLKLNYANAFISQLLILSDNENKNNRNTFYSLKFSFTINKRKELVLP
jgi:hypothetical protein